MGGASISATRTAPSSVHGDGLDVDISGVIDVTSWGVRQSRG